MPYWLWLLCGTALLRGNSCASFRDHLVRACGAYDWGRRLLDRRHRRAAGALFGQLDNPVFRRLGLAEEEHENE